MNRQVLEEAHLFDQWLTIELAPTICGSKPATILSLVNTPAQALFTQWKLYGKKLLLHTPIRFVVLCQTDERETVFFYCPKTLGKCLEQQDHCRFLEELGYPVQQGITACLILLKKRFRASCPHEVGLLLGIPLKDVSGFMGKSSTTLTCRKTWCVYGNPQESFKIMEQFDQDRSKICTWLAQGMNCCDILNGRMNREITGLQNEVA